MHSITKVAIIISLVLSTSAVADEEFRQHDAHEHGHVELNIAQDGKELLMEIHAPGADVLGFEHAPKNDQQQKALEQAIAQLENAGSLFALTASAGCKIKHQSVANNLSSDKHDEHKHDNHHQDEHDHDHHADNKDHDGHDEHDSHHQDEHNHGHHADNDDHEHEEHHHDHDSGHGEFAVEYHYQCDNLNALSSINTQWFTHFPATKSISVNLLTDKTQTALELSSSNTKISL